MTFTGRRFRIIGDSHVHAIAGAAGQPGGAAGWAPDFVCALAAANEFYEPFFSAAQAQIVLYPGKIRDRLRGEFCDEDGVALPPDGTFTFLSMGFHTQTFLASKRFESHRHWRAQSLPDRQTISDAAFAAMVIDLHVHVLAFVRALRDGGHPVAILQAPPPTRRFALLRKGHSPGDVLLLDGLFRAVMTRQFAELGIPVIAPPEGTSEDGFLKPEFLSPDPADTHHGNTAYASRVLARLAATCAPAPG